MPLGVPRSEATKHKISHGNRGRISSQVQRYIDLHLNHNLSTSQIAKRCGVKKNTVIQALRYHGSCQQAYGIQFEQQVANLLTSQGKIVERMRGDSPFDLRVDGHAVEVKSASLCHKRYHFEINHRQSKTYSPQYWAYLLLVFKDKAGVPVYRIETSDLPESRHLCIPEDLTTYKYPLTFIGHLNEN